jgi:hypothetical protein
LLPGRNLRLSGGWQHLSLRRTRSGARARPVALLDFTATTSGLHPLFDVQCGVRNVLNWRYDEPVDLDVERLRAPGRAAYVKLIWRWQE